MTTVTTVHLEEDSNGDLVLPLTLDVLNQVGWKPDDTLKWIDNSDGTFSIIKYENSDSQ